MHTRLPLSTTLAMAALTLAACTDERPIEAPPEPPSLDATTPELSPRAVYARASLDIRGRRPSLAELERLDSDPGTLGGMLDALLEDPHFHTTVRDWFSRAARTRTGEYEFFERVYAEPPPGYSHALGEELLHLVAHVATTDRPFTEIVTADYTFVNEHLIGIYPVAGYDLEVGGWQKVRYDDDRPAGGLLATNSFMRRYLTNDTNKNRGRFNAASRILRCDNYLERPVDFPRDIDLTDEAGVQNAIENNPACVSCHWSLDPGAATMYGLAELPDRDVYTYYVNQTYDAFEPFYQDQGAGGQGLVEEFPQAEPAYYGERARDLGDLGQAIARDPKFSHCMTKSTYEFYIGRPADSADLNAIRHHREAFEASGMRYKALVRSILDDPIYRGASDASRVGERTKTIAPEALSDALHNLTGFTYAATLGVEPCEESDEPGECAELRQKWSDPQWRSRCLTPDDWIEFPEDCEAAYDGSPYAVDLMRDGLAGLRVLGGGLDARSGDYPSRTLNAPRVLVQNRMAEAAAAYLVYEERDRLEALLGDEVNMEEVPRRAQIGRLGHRFFSRPMGDDELAAYEGLVGDLDGVARDPEEVWILLIGAMLRDPLFVNY